MNINNKSIKSVYLIAICGTGMTALAGMLKSRGYDVRGSDQNVYPPMSTFLKDMGIPVREGFDEKNLDPHPDLVVIGNSMSRGNPEVEAALEKKLPYISLPMALREFFIRGHHSCVIAGTHGKTTTASLFAWVLENAGKDPGFFIGGLPENFGQGFKLGNGSTFISEGDEYDSAFFDKRSKFLLYLPDLVILNNIEFDHADIFASIDEIEVTFSRLINLIPRNGYLVACSDDDLVRRLSQKTLSNLVTFGLIAGAEWLATDIQPGTDGTTFEVVRKGKAFGSFRTPLYGQHMIKNCLGVVAASHLLGLTVTEIADGLATFKNVRRRLQFKGEANGIKVFDDFAHHPTEVESTIAGMRSRFPDQRLWAVFEPRTATSKRRLFQERFVQVLNAADRVILTPLHLPEKVPSEERLSVKKICEQLNSNGTPCEVLPANNEMLAFLKANLAANDIVLFMSNGNFNQLPNNLANEL